MFPEFSPTKFGQLVLDLAEIPSDTVDVAVSGTTENLERLADLPIETLRILNCNQLQFERLLGLVRPRLLVAYNVQAGDLSPLESQTQLKSLCLDWNSKAESLSPISRLPSLTVLRLNDLKKVRDLSPLRDCSGLIRVALCGGVWNAFRVRSLEPLASLQKVSQLQILNVRVETESLEPLTRMASLAELELSNQFPTQEYAKLAALRRDVKCPHLAPYVRLGEAVADTLNGKDVMVVGKKKPFLSWKSDQTRIEKYVAEFDRMKAQFAEMT